MECTTSRLRAARILLMLLARAALFTHPPTLSSGPDYVALMLSASRLRSRRSLVGLIGADFISAHALAALTPGYSTPPGCTVGCPEIRRIASLGAVWLPAAGGGAWGRFLPHPVTSAPLGGTRARVSCAGAAGGSDPGSGSSEHTPLALGVQGRADRPSHTVPLRASPSNWRATHLSGSPLLTLCSVSFLPLS